MNAPSEVLWTWILIARIMDRIKELILRFLREELSRDDERELESWLSVAPRNRALLDEIQDADSLAASFAKLERLDKEGVWKRIKTYAEEQKAAAVPMTDQPNRFRRGWWAAAAVFILLAGGGWFWFRSAHTETIAKNQSQIPKYDVLPGGNKAVLTLSGGRQIILDSAANGAMAQQGNATIQKLSNGQLAYQRIDEKPATVVYNTLTTPRGGQYQLILSDGTKVWLNSASSIIYPVTFTGNTREIEITGEAYFEVAHNDKHPFRVKVGNETIEDIGTAFNINAYKDEEVIKTTLLEGSVRVTLSTVAGSSDRQQEIIKPGEQAQVSSTGQIGIVSDIDVDQVVAWKNGLFAFTDADLPVVMRQLARWYDIDVVYEGNISKREFNGKIGKSLTLDQVLKVLTKTRVHYSIEGKKLTIRP